MFCVPSIWHVLSHLTFPRTVWSTGPHYRISPVEILLIFFITKPQRTYFFLSTAFLCLCLYWGKNTLLSIKLCIIFLKTRWGVGTILIYIPGRTGLKNIQIMCWHVENHAEFNNTAVHLGHCCCWDASSPDVSSPSL